MGGKIASVLLLVLALGAIVYFVRSGTLGEIFSLADDFKFNLEFSTPDLVPPQSYGGTSVQVTSPASSGGTANSSATQTRIEPRSNAPEGFSEADLSPNFGKVRIGSVSAGSENSYGRIVLSVGLGIDVRINVSGWELRANRGSQFVPQAVGVYDPTGLAAENDILLGSGEILTLYTTQSAIGKNIRLNKCIGYLENTNKFRPSLPTNCPYLRNESGISTYTGKCQDYIRSIGSCHLPNAEPDIPNNDYACKVFLDTINYRGCYDRHRGDADFLSRDWWAWTGRRFLDERHDKILLLDKGGKLVDVYSY